MLPISSVGCTWGCPDPVIVPPGDPAFTAAALNNPLNGSNRITSYALTQQNGQVHGFATNPVSGPFVAQGVFYSYDATTGAKLSEVSVANARSFVPDRSVIDQFGAAYFVGKVFTPSDSSSGVSVVKVEGSSIAWTADILSSVAGARPINPSLGLTSAADLVVVAHRGLATNAIAAELNTTTGVSNWVRDINNLRAREISSASTPFGTLIVANIDTRRPQIILLSLDGNTILWQIQSSAQITGGSSWVPSLHVSPDGTEFVVSFYSAAGYFGLVRGSTQTGTIIWARDYSSLNEAGFYSLNFRPVVEHDGTTIKIVFDFYGYTFGEQTSYYAILDLNGLVQESYQIRHNIGFAYASLYSGGIDDTGAVDAIHLAYLDSNNAGKIIRLNTTPGTDYSGYQHFTVVPASLFVSVLATTWPTTSAYTSIASAQSVVTTNGAPAAGTLTVNISVIEPI